MTCNTTTITVNIEDVNDNPPIFTQPEYDFSKNIAIIYNTAIITAFVTFINHFRLKS